MIITKVNISEIVRCIVSNSPYKTDLVYGDLTEYVVDRIIGKTVYLKIGFSNDLNLNRVPYYEIK